MQPIPWRSSWGRRRWDILGSPCPKVWKYTAAPPAPSCFPKPTRSQDRSYSPEKKKITKNIKIHTLIHCRRTSIHLVDRCDGQRSPPSSSSSSSKQQIHPVALEGFFKLSPHLSCWCCSSYHFSIVGETLLKHPVQEDRGERCCAVAWQLLFAQHAVVVLIKIEILAYRDTEKKKMEKNRTYNRRFLQLLLVC